MDNQKIINLLAKGIDPTTGKKFEANNILNKPLIIRALYEASNAIEELNKLNLKSKSNVKNTCESSIENKLLDTGPKSIKVPIGT